MTTITFRLKGGTGSGNFGHSGRPGKIGGSSGGGASPMAGHGGFGHKITVSTAPEHPLDAKKIEAGKQAITQRFQSLGAKNITFKKNDDGSFDVWAQSKGSNKAKFTKNRVMPDGKVYLTENGKPTVRII